MEQRRLAELREKVTLLETFRRHGTNLPSGASPRQEFERRKTLYSEVSHLVKLIQDELKGYKGYLTDFKTRHKIEELEEEKSCGAVRKSA